MAVRVIKGSWWIDFRHEYVRYRRRSPENTRSGALAYEAAVRHRLLSGQTVPKAADPNETFGNFAERWFADYVVPNNKPSEQRSKRTTLRCSLLPFFGRTRLDAITPYLIEQYKARELRKGLSPKTINNRLAVLNRCLVSAYEWNELKAAPRRIKLLKCPPPATDYLSSEECSVLLRHARGALRDMLLLSLRTGMRQGEVKGLQWSSINWATQTLIVRHSYCDHQKRLGSPKSNRERQIPLSEEVHEMLLKQRQDAGFVFLTAKGEPFTHKSITWELTTLCKRAGLRRVTWHTLRHTFASHLAMKGVPLPAIQTLLGHSTIAMTMRYAHVAPSTLRTAIDLLERGFGPDHGHPVGNPWVEMHSGGLQVSEPKREYKASKPQN